MTRLQQVCDLDGLANYLGYTSYEDLKSLVYPTPFYTVFKLPKRTGGERVIHAPGLALKQVQRQIADDLRDVYGQRSPVAHAFVAGRSIVSNAIAHVGRASVVRVDLKDFFGTINFGRVKGFFEGNPFNFPHEVATAIAQICCVNGSLPQGAPTSAALSNFICFGLDKALVKLVRRFKGRYTRYADDLTFSFRYLPVEKIANDFLVVTGVGKDRVVRAGALLKAVIEAQGFFINEKKTSGSNKGVRQLVTGLVVNEKLGVTRQYINEVRRALFIWERGGLVVAEKKCVPVLHRRTYQSGKYPSLVNTLRGKLTHLLMVVGETDSDYLNFAQSFNRLVKRDAPGSCAPLRARVVFQVKRSQDAIRATWYLETNENEGTAFRFNQFYWVTCAHCVGDMATKHLYEGIRLSAGDWSVVNVKVRVHRVDWDRDLAILRPVAMQAVPLSLPFFAASPVVPIVESRLGTYGFANARLRQAPVFTRTRVTRMGTRKSILRIEVDKHIHQGNSGGPLFDDHYQVVGVVTDGASFNEQVGHYGAGENAAVSIIELDALMH